jgi:nitrous oxidase accessory protein NosD
MNLLVLDTISRDNGNSLSDGAGLLVSGASAGKALVTVDGCEFRNNGHSGTNYAGGIIVSSNADVTVRRSVLTANFRGAHTEGTGRLALENCVISENEVGLYSNGFGTPSPRATIRVSNCVVTYNRQLAIQVLPGGQVLSRGNNTVADNAAGETFSGTFVAK